MKFRFKEICGLCRFFERFFSRSVISGRPFPKGRCKKAADFCVRRKVEPGFPVAKIRGELERRMHVCLSLEDMCAMTGYSKNQIIRLFRKDTGMTPIQFQMARKMEFAAKLLLYSNQTITQIGAQVGMEDSNYFSKTFRKYIGESPRSYRNRLRTE